MKNLIIISTYFNNPHFIELQYKTFNKYITEDFDFVVIDDSAEDTKAILSDNIAGYDIMLECEKYNLKHLRIPQHIHKNISEGGLVPDGLPASHPTERHRAVLHWIFRNYKSFGEYKVLMLVDADFFFKKNINIRQYMGDYDIMGTAMSGRLIKTGNPDQFWPDNISHLQEIDATWLSFQLLIVNLEKVKNLENINAGGFAGSDTGGLSHLYLQENPNYKVCFLNKYLNIQHKIDFYAKNPTASCDEAEFVHYRSGANWDYQSIEYYREKLNRLFKKYIPEFYIEGEKIKSNLTSRDGKHILTPED